VPSMAGAFSGATAYMVLRADPTQLRGDINRAVSSSGMGAAGSKAGGAYAGGVRSALGSLRGIFAAVGVLGFAAGMGAAVKAGADLQLSQVRLQGAVKRTGTSWAAYAPLVGRAQTQMEKYGFTTADTNGALSALMRQTGDSALSMRLLSVTANVAASRNINLADALSIVRTGIIGNARTLRQYNITAVTGANAAAAMAKAQATLKDQIQSAGGMANFARARNLSLGTATKLAGDAAKGSIPAFNRLGIEVLPATATSAQRAEQFINTFTMRLGGAAATRAKTFTGQMAILKAEVIDFAARAAMIVLPALTGLMRVFTGAGTGATILRTALVSALLALAAWKTVSVVVTGVKALAGAYRSAAEAITLYQFACMAATGAGARLPVQTRLLSLALRGLPLVGTVALIGGLAVGFVYLANVLARGQMSVDQYARQLRTVTNATGFSTRAQLDYYHALMNTTAAHIINGDSAGRAQRNYNVYALATEQLTAKQRQARAEFITMDTALSWLGTRYGLTRDQVIQLAVAAGVHASALRSGGAATQGAIDKITAYADATQKAQAPVSQLNTDLSRVSNTTLTMNDRLNALSNSLSLFFNPAIAADNAAITLGNDFRTLRDRLGESAGKMGLYTQSQRDSRGAFNQTITDVGSLYQSVLAQTGSTEEARKAVERWIPKMYAAAGGNKEQRRQVDLLRGALGLLPANKNVNVNVHGTGSGSIVLNATGVAAKIRSILAFHAEGGLVRGVGGPRSDANLIAASRGEFVQQASAVDKYGVAAMHAVNEGRAVIGYASGGLVGLGAEFSAAPGWAAGVAGQWGKSALSPAISAVVDAVKKALAAAAAAMAAGSGSALVRLLRPYVGKVPYVWGGTSPSGWDCSGMVQWGLGKLGVQAPRTSEAQYQWVRRTGDQAGALVFFVGAGGAPPGHVGVSMGNGKMINAAGTQWGTIISGTGGNMGFGVPPGGYASGGAAKLRKLGHGGIIDEHVLGIGASGGLWEFGEAGREVVTPEADLSAKLDRLIGATDRLAARTGAAVADALTNMARGSSQRAWAGGRYG
jgi:cell wall-associated NlpC family hydrolase